MSRALSERIAGAPISWGVCEVPGWGHQLRPERVLEEMQQLGLSATEFGPVGFLPHDPTERRHILLAHGLTAVGGFVPVVLHKPFDPALVLTAVMTEFVATGASTLVLAAATGLDGYDVRPSLGASEWRSLLSALDSISRLAAELGIQAVLHPHVGTVVETADEVERVLAGSEIALCLDTGHLLIGGADPLNLARQAGGRVGHVHLKDVHADLADRVRNGQLTYSSAVREGLYPVLGTGDVDIAGVVSSLEYTGYDGWYVLEQDVTLEAEPADRGPAAAVEAAIQYVTALGSDLEGSPR